MIIINQANLQKPEWLKIRLPGNWDNGKVSGVIDILNLQTVCRSAACPNIGQCYHSGTATFLILGDKCTRLCRFCAVKKGIPEKVDLEEPQKLAEAVKELGLKHVVITSVTRDDLLDGGSEQFAACIRAIRTCVSATVEVLIPDFGGSREAVARVLAERPEVFNHNIETVPRLYSSVRPNAYYQRSLNVLKQAVEESGTKIKSGLMVGLGENEEEVIEVLKDLMEAGVCIVTIGQYLRPSPQHLAVTEYIQPAQFVRYEQIARKMGFTHVAAGPLVRSSYNAAAFLK
ncbi:lipoyl synthase [Dendrosporobacter sp. 1207_IL3150]|uniref:lipoyl synthase n=1 Tax=Dendrosporobacter sp. 1207_IL3150 TaxID=3084054 RepID=UPI002FDABFEA